ncbi:MAG: radical SAM family heme chaperone HemW [Deltaproteobacteria bacterium]|jgi:oxygen-independent coproporphyrinogen-3 oxidase|nr:radical SAM family heme chaperone HemW [Deltaproteobacteria bacterium]
MNLMSDKAAGLYIHIPFCVRKCPYCDFYSVTDLALRPMFMKALIAEMQLVFAEGLSFDTLYIGGGTPSICRSAEIGQIVTSAFEHFDFLPNPETTIEVNPGTVSVEQLRGYWQAGINRINIGVQSFYQKNLDFLGRIHKAKEAHGAIENAQRAGFKNIGVDLIYGLPGQSQDEWSRDLVAAIGHNPAHLACYMLAYEDGTPLQKCLKKGRFQPLAEDRVRALFDITIEFLEDHGYFQYEISNFARIETAGTQKSRETNVSRHNLKYWTLAPYIGLGPSAHSFIESQRYWNVSSVDQYCEAVESGRLPLAENEKLSREQQIIEAIYLGLRMTRGIDLAGFKKKFGIDFIDAFRELILDLKKRNYIAVTKDHCALTRQARAFLDNISAMFVYQDLNQK